MNKTQLNCIEVVLAEKDISHRELGAGIGKGEVTISRYCTNTRQPTLQILNDIANFLEVDVRRLLVPNKFATEPREK